LRNASRGGVLEKIQETIDELSREFEKHQQDTPAPQEPVAVLAPGPSLISYVPSLLEFLASAALVVALLLFMLIAHADLRDRLFRLVGYGRLTVTTKALDEAGRRISRYLLMQSLLNGTYGCAVSLGLFVLGGEFWDKVHALFVHDAKVVQSVTVEASGPAAPVQVGARFYIGAAIFAMGLLIWGLVPLASAAGWSGTQIASLTGGIFVANKVGMLVAIAVMGKPGFNHLKRLLFGLLRRVGPPARVSRNRYGAGIVLFAITIALSWVKPYAFGIDADGLYELVANVPLTLLLLVSVFVLGGDFWDKLGALFRYRTKVAFPDDGTSPGRHLP